MTKLIEEYWRGTVSGAVEYFKSQPARGEFTLVIAGKEKVTDEKWTEAQLLTTIQKELQSEKSAKDISVELAEQSGWNKKEIYALINQNK
jgi:16S rRNA (cytidine1402-2'-O)-methyltransferase